MTFIDGKTALAEIVANLDQPYEGPWEIEEFQQDMRPNGLIVSRHGTIIAEIRGYLDSCGNRENAEHIIRCSPDRMRAIAKYVAELERLASPVPAAESGWRDIASAPKDGTWILVFEPAGNPPYHVARWGEYEPGFNDGDETWVTIAIGPNPDTYEPTPTHWRPLPHPQEKSE